MATYYRVPLPRPEQTFVTQQTELSGIAYTFKFRYNIRRDLWEMSLLFDGDTAVVESVAMVAEWDMLSAVSNEDRPPGSLILFTTDGTPPGAAGFENAALYYVVS